MKAWHFLRGSVAALGLLAVSNAASAQNYPTKPIDLSVWAAAGGGTDATNRFLAQAMEKALGGKINVSNRTGGGGGVAMTHVWNQPRDGYTWLGASEAMQITKVMEFHKTGTADWRWYMVAGAPGVISVRAESPYKTLDDLIAAAQKSPKSVKVGHCPIGCVWHMRALALGQASKTEFNYIPYDGSSPAHVAALTGEADAVVSGVAEQTEFIRAGKLRPLAMIEMKPFEFPKVGTIPAAGVKYPDIQKIPARQWLGMAIPKDTPKPIIAKIDAAFVKAMEDPKVKSLASERMFVLSGEYGDEAEKSLQAMENAMSWKLFELGVAKTSPDKLGIAKP
ncbi:tripartite tricarboxylate transporter substrate binding protein [Bosea sp. (in: a-proteobacteria)]|jgi:tripartite-type tricarboxylate transporter receptor subunit TctC|uniref:Bug family tripartite tricarboxylate transporter substrate binding protein n=1 Tax=Bosea sp. (in: a-proteobacteria) TaxID=1871050 RepID=UPI001AC2CF02|nr:tripartite tricarboxylate transporter substrate binding protein [Bosea sp. (in: a-proteobacteria)]MBN9438812.1 tripartite tricarboxylate transporter substrate binding protein [Bosea sp. (in: a-proteobacteria)]MBN9447340.1 tripartite tricarboxylate transporter substrate binding protein [Bosea sp. (in: a-proteobacteria)]